MGEVGHDERHGSRGWPAGPASRDVRHVSAAALAERCFAGRADGLRPPDNSEELLVATT